jgi:hypothetical protein
MVELYPSKEYSIHVVANGYEPVIARFAPLNFIKNKQFSIDFILKKKKVIAKAEPNLVIQSKEFGVIEKAELLLCAIYISTRVVLFYEKNHFKN